MANRKKFNKSIRSGNSGTFSGRVKSAWNKQMAHTTKKHMFKKPSGNRKSFT